MDILLIISALPVLLIGMFIYAKDKNKEPKSLLTKLLLGGIGSAFLTIFISEILAIFIPNFNKLGESRSIIVLMIYAFLCVALVEEFSKWIFAYKLTYNNKEFDEFYDMIIYCVFVALGFALFENILYVLQGGIVVGITRALLAVPGHACDGVFMGYFLGLTKIADLNGKPQIKKRNMALSIIVPTLMHGTYDFLLFTNNLLFLGVFLVLVIIMYVVSIKKVKAVSSINKNFYKRPPRCPNCGLECDTNFCGNCGTKL